jgi:hypothetical protein
MVACAGGRSRRHTWSPTPAGGCARHRCWVRWDAALTVTLAIQATTSPRRTNAASGARVRDAVRVTNAAWRVVPTQHTPTNCLRLLPRGRLHGCSCGDKNETGPVRSFSLSGAPCCVALVRRARNTRTSSDTRQNATATDSRPRSSCRRC